MRRRKRIVILAHGGAGGRAASPTQLKIISAALEAGRAILHDGGSCLEAVEAAIRLLEDSGVFNAGVGSRLQLDGRRRMDAAIMEGRGLSAGAVAGLEDVANPITAALRVLTHTPHVLIAGEGARRLAEHFDLEPAGPPTEESMTILRRALRRDNASVRLYREMESHETVGAVARDAEGRLAAGTSTGGIAEMLPGRVGDSPIIGSGLYADDESGAVSMTGVGEGILRGVVAKEICDGLRDGRPPRRAGRDALRRLLSRIHATAGAIVLDRRGRFALIHSTPRLCAGYAVADRPSVSADRFRRIV